MCILRFNDDRRILEERNKICFRDPQNLHYKKDGVFVQLSKEECKKYECCICYEAVIDPKMCSKASC